MCDNWCSAGVATGAICAWFYVCVCVCCVCMLCVCCVYVGVFKCMCAVACTNLYMCVYMCTNLFIHTLPPLFHTHHPPPTHTCGPTKLMVRITAFITYSFSPLSGWVNAANNRVKRGSSCMVRSAGVKRGAPCSCGYMKGEGVWKV